MTEYFEYQDIAKMIDFTLLDPTLTTREFDEGCAFAVQQNLASVCIPPYYVARCAEMLAGTTVRTATAVGYPHGGQRTALKVAEARQALRDGAQELEVTINFSKVRSGDWQYVNDELFALTQTIHGEGAKIKVVSESSWLYDDSKAFLCQICGALGVDWVGNSSEALHGELALAEVELMRSNSPKNVQIKAAAGMRNLDLLLAARNIGVSRVGSNRVESILKESRKRIKRSRVTRIDGWIGNGNSTALPTLPPLVFEVQRMTGTDLTRPRV